MRNSGTVFKRIIHYKIPVEYFPTSWAFSSFEATRRRLMPMYSKTVLMHQLIKKQNSTQQQAQKPERHETTFHECKSHSRHY